MHLPCVFEEHTADIDDNRLLAWTLHCLIRSGSIDEDVRPIVRHAYQHLRSAATITPFRPSDCVGRQYDRLNQDYELLHALCRFFLEYSGPSHSTGDRSMLPFLIDMAGLFELFVAEWLRAHLPAGLSLHVQHHMNIGDDAALQFQIDLAIVDDVTGVTRFVLDTKYKSGPVAQPDVYQLVTYATAMKCGEAILVYPTKLAKPLDERIGSIRVRSVAFDLGGDLEAAGQAFLGAVVSGK
jgi:5-methylcytosine-specific restriction enzyme subunit McrC